MTRSAHKGGPKEPHWRLIVTQADGSGNWLFFGSVASSSKSLLTLHLLLARTQVALVDEIHELPPPVARRFQIPDGPSGLVECQHRPMAHIAPFRALRYDPARVDLSQVVTQPYDKITPGDAGALLRCQPAQSGAHHPGQAGSRRSRGKNTYTRAAAYFQDWRRQGIFLQDAQPSIYSYAQHFTVPGGSKESRTPGIHCLGTAGRLLRQCGVSPRADPGQAQG